MAKKYYNAEDVHRRLFDTLVFYKDLPYIVSNVRNDDWNKITLTDFRSYYNPREVDKGLAIPAPITIDHDDKDLITTAPELGNANINKSVYYVSRRPLRRQNQGLLVSCCYSSPKFPMGGWQYCKGFWEMLQDIYPSQDEAVEKIRNLDAVTVAISRTLSIGYAGNTTSIGMFMGSSAGHQLIATLDRYDRFKLIESESTSFLRRFLNKTGVVRNIA